MFLFSSGFRVHANVKRIHLSFCRKLITVQDIDDHMMPFTVPRLRGSPRDHLSVALKATFTNISVHLGGPACGAQGGLDGQTDGRIDRRTGVVHNAYGSTSRP